MQRNKESWAAIFAALPDGRSTKLDAFSRPAVSLFEANRTKAGICGSTLNRDWTAVQAFFRWLGDHQPDLDARLPRRTRIAEPDDEPRNIPPEHRERIRAQCPPDWWQFFEFLRDTGVRIGEGQFLERRDPTGNTLTVQPNKHRALKTPKARRELPLSTAAQAIVAAQLAHPGRPTDLLWPQKFRDYDAAYRVLERACIAAELHDDREAHRARLAAQVARGKITSADAERVKIRRAALYRPHCFRHTLGFALVDAGVPVTVVRDLMGHSTVSVTERCTKARSQAQHLAAVRAALSANRPVPSPSTGRDEVDTPPEPQGAEPQPRPDPVGAETPRSEGGISYASAVG